MNDGLKIRPANMNRSNAPKNSRPSRIVTPPSTWVIPSVRLKQLADPARGQADQREHGREAEDEQRRPRDRPARGRAAGAAAEVLARVVTPPPAPASAALRSAPARDHGGGSRRVPRSRPRRTSR